MLGIGSPERNLRWRNLHRRAMIGQCAHAKSDLRMPAVRAPGMNRVSECLVSGRIIAAALIALATFSSNPAHGDQRADFLAGRTRECPRCDLAGMNFKRRDLSGADLTGANLREANFHDAKLTGA